MKKLSYLIIIVLISSLVLGGCTLLSNISQVPTTGQSGIAYLTKGVPSGLVGLWHFDEGSGIAAYDSSGNPNDGTLKPTGLEPTWVIGKFGNALSFDGTNGYVQVADDPSLDITTAITIEAWINPAILGGWKYIVSKRLGNVANYGFRLLGQSVEFYYRKGPSPTSWQVWRSAPDVVSTGSWQHVAVAFTFGSGSVALYVNGAPVSGSWTTGDGLVEVFANDYPLRIGALYEGLLLPFNGLIDEVRIWDKALLPGDILNPGISVEKSGPETAHVGDIITYTYTVTNAGYVPLSDVTVSDNLAGGASHVNGDDNTNGLLDLEEDWIFTADYEVPPGVDPVVNIATVFGTNPLDDSDVTAEADWSVDILNPAIEVEKSGPETAAPGDTVAYSYTVTNVGDCALLDVSLLDNVVGAITLIGLTDEDTDGLDDDLAQGASATGTDDYLVTFGDPEWLVNIAIASGTDELGSIVDDEASWTVHTMCARSIGYWGNHQEDWCGLPSESMFSLVEPSSTLLTYFPGNGIEEDGVNPLEMLRVQLLAAELNVACFDVDFDYNRYEGDLGGYGTIYDVIVAAEDFLIINSPELWPTDKAEQREFRKDNADSLALKDVLDTFNNMGDECFPIEEESNTNSNE